MMENGALSINRNIQVSHLVKARYASSKISLPVKKSQFLYSNFKHVTGIPAGTNGRGYSLTKLRALDNLIERLGRLGKGSEAPSLKEKIDSEALNQLIDQYAGDLHTAAIQTNPYAGFGADTGLLVNIIA
jgi:hypothetical protein